MEPRILQIEDEILAADFSTTDGIRAFEDRARSEYTAEELWILADSSVDEWGTMSKRTSACKRSIKWLADEAINLIALIRGLGAGGIKYPLVETEDGNKMIHPYLTYKCDLATGKQIDELYNQTIVSLRMMAARAKENNATVQDVAHDVRAARADIAAVCADAKRGADAAERVDARLPEPRADKGQKHTKRKNISGAWRSAADVADDFNKSAFMPKGGKRKLGTCDEAKINRWDADCPDYEHKNKWGYYARLRIDPNLKSEYAEVVGLWAAHWDAYKKWDKQHPGVKFRGMIRTDIDTARIGRDEQGDLVVEPRPDQRRT